MLAERDHEELRQKVIEFVEAGMTGGINLYQIEGAEVTDGRFLNDFCVAAFPADERLGTIEFAVFSDKENTTVRSLEKIFETDFTIFTNKYSKKASMDDMLEATRFAISEGLPIFTISYGKMEETGKRAYFINAFEGFPPHVVADTLRRYAEIQLFGGEFKFDI